MTSVTQNVVGHVGRGRPRNPEIETRILEAALILYGQAGWQGFNLEGVARGAKVSKDAIYRRWKSRESLLEAALHPRMDRVVAINNGNIRDDLLTLATRAFEFFSGPYGEAAMRLRADARGFPEARKLIDPYKESMVLQGRSMVRRALKRGELPPQANPGLIMDLLIGGITNHIVATPPELRDKMIAGAEPVLRIMVDVILQGVHQVLGIRADNR